ncbi:MAG: hypothetical protein HY791_40140 [Deltaproteobacteria bacterium]|nr:hypothetical protein [Deltaproteobacteria bacterium]
MPRLPKKPFSVSEALAPVASYVEDANVAALAIEPSGRLVILYVSGLRQAKPTALDSKDVARGAHAIRTHLGAAQGAASGPVADGLVASIAATADGDAIRLTRRSDRATLDQFASDGSMAEGFAEHLGAAMRAGTSLVVTASDPVVSSEVLEALTLLVDRTIAVIGPTNAALPSALRFSGTQVTDAALLGADLLVSEKPPPAVLLSILMSGRPFVISCESSTARAALRGMVARIAFERPGVDTSAAEALVESCVDLFVESSRARRIVQLAEPTREEGRLGLRTLVRETTNGVEARLSGSRLAVRLGEASEWDGRDSSPRAGIESRSGISAIHDVAEAPSSGPVGQVRAGELDRLRPEELVSKSFLVDVGGFSRSAEGKSSMFQPGLVSIEAPDPDEDEDEVGSLVPEPLADAEDDEALVAQASAPADSPAEPWDDDWIDDEDETKGDDEEGTADEPLAPELIEAELATARAPSDRPVRTTRAADDRDLFEEDEEASAPAANNSPISPISPIMRATARVSDDNALVVPADRKIRPSTDWSSDDELVEDASDIGTGIEEVPADFREPRKVSIEDETADDGGDEEPPDWSEGESEETMGSDKEESVRPRRPVVRAAPERLPTDVLSDRPPLSGPAGLPQPATVDWDEAKTGHAVDPSEDMAGAPNRPRVRAVDFVMTQNGEMVAPDQDIGFGMEPSGEIQERDLLEAVDPSESELERKSSGFDEHTPVLAAVAALRPAGRPLARGFDEGEATMLLPDGDGSMAGSEPPPPPPISQPAPQPVAPVRPEVSPRPRPRPSPSRVGRAISRFRKK